VGGTTNGVAPDTTRSSSAKKEVQHREDHLPQPGRSRLARTIEEEVRAPPRNECTGAVSAPQQLDAGDQIVVFCITETVQLGDQRAAATRARLRAARRLRRPVRRWCSSIEPRRLRLDGDGAHLPVEPVDPQPFASVADLELGGGRDFAAHRLAARGAAQDRPSIRVARPSVVHRTRFSTAG
jgi:hypothetical protein